MEIEEMLKELREKYRADFVNGMYDQTFMLWIETQLNTWHTFTEGDIDNQEFPNGH